MRPVFLPGVHYGACGKGPLRVLPWKEGWAGQGKIKPVSMVFPTGSFFSRIYDFVHPFLLSRSISSGFPLIFS
jgi:hypothetical protein